MIIVKYKTLGTPGETVWFDVEQIVAVTAGVSGLANVFTTDGKMYFLTERADAVVQKIWGADD